MGCSLAASLAARIKDIKRTVNPAYLFIEPSEMVLTQEMHDATRMGLRDVRYQIGPFITLIDGPAFASLWEERQPLLLGQIHKADLVAISRADLLSPAQSDAIIQTLKDYQSFIIPLSSKVGQGVEEVMSKVVL